MTLDHRQGHLQSLRSFISIFIYPVQFLASIPADTGDWVSENLSTRRSLSEENIRLKTRQLTIEARLQKLEALESENRRLRDLLKSSTRVDEEFIIAEFVSVDMAPFSRQIVINKGAIDNVYIGQPIIDASGIIGQVTNVGRYTSNIMLVTDPNHAIPVEVNRNGLRAIAVGTGEPDQLRISHIAAKADIQINDLLVTSGLGGRFPSGYPVARVTEVFRTPDNPFASVEAVTIPDIESTREILLIQYKKFDETTTQNERRGKQ